MAFSLEIKPESSNVQTLMVRPAFRNLQSELNSSPYLPFTVSLLLCVSLSPCHSISFFLRSLDLSQIMHCVLNLQ
jgi:hypothetical protein